MTFEQCQRVLVSIRREQGTRCPLVRVEYAGTVVRGRLARADSDPEFGQGKSPFGLLVVESLGLAGGPETVLQIANIPANGLHSMEK